ncbi:MAG: GNAT family N-acetyltransferase [Treponema sp.]|nr:GNAT family N-acetyltransferase [Treponema sp.]
MNLKYTMSGFIYISPEDDCHETVDAMLATDYSGEFCIAEGFDPIFTAKLMEAGFLVMSINIAENEGDPYYIMLPKLHLVRSALFFDNLHIKKSVKRLLSRYELKADVEFDRIIGCCVEKHGSDWLTPPLVDCIKKIRRNAKINRSSADITSVSACLEFPDSGFLTPAPYPYPASFALYRGEKLTAGEFGIIYGNVYTSYSGFYEEDNAGTVQLILAAQYLKEHGFSFFDMGMPLDYKTDLGAVDISPQEFVRLFRGEE